MLILPQTADYALRAMSYIAEHQALGPVPVSAVAEALGAPRNYLSKTLYRLSELGLLRSVRGARGGYCLGVPARQVRLADIVEPFLPVVEQHCIMGHPRCREEVPCGAHRRWKQVQDTARSFFADLSLGDLLAGSTPGHPSLTRPSTTTPRLETT